MVMWFKKSSSHSLAYKQRELTKMVPFYTLLPRLDDCLIATLWSTFPS